VHPVQGKVFYEKKPAFKALVFLHPAEPADPPDPLPRGVVREDGSFRITTYAPEDGAPVGQYTVTVVWKSQSRYGDSTETNLLPARYMSPATSNLTVQVREGTNELEPFNLNR
jgi:hypothetical protein